MDCERHGFLHIRGDICEACDFECVASDCPDAVDGFWHEHVGTSTYLWLLHRESWVARIDALLDRKDG